MKFTCCVCGFKFEEVDFDTDERMCFDCLFDHYYEGDDDNR
jgi:hypothetical protein